MVRLCGSKIVCQVSCTGFARKLEEILCELEPLVDQGKIAGFFSNVENSEKLGGLAEDIRNVVVEYQVCAYIRFIFVISEACTRPHYNKISMIRVVCLL